MEAALRLKSRWFMFAIAVLRTVRMADMVR